MKILFVAMTESIHTARWISQINDQNWEIQLFPSTYSSATRRQIKNVTIYNSLFPRKGRISQQMQFRSWRLFLNRIVTLFGISLDKINPNYRANKLNRLIKKIKPDIVHSLEFQSAGYLVLKSKELFKGEFPKWITTNWGSDIYWFGRFPEHKDKITKILKNCDYYSCECNRDVCLVKTMGVKANILPVFPNTGGFNLKSLEKMRKNRTSQRKLIMLKGYQGWVGRSQVALKALELCQDLLKGYKIIIYSVQPGTNIETSAKRFKSKTGIPVEIIKLNFPHEKILSLHGRARISIGLNMADAISTSFLEAMVMGSFPIQSDTACADEWTTNGETSFLVPPEDPHAISEKIREALTNDKLVDEAAEANWKTAIARLDFNLLKKETINLYQTVNDGSKTV